VSSVNSVTLSGMSAVVYFFCRSAELLKKERCSWATTLSWSSNQIPMPNRLPLADMIGLDFNGSAGILCALRVT
jgi:hypothetical protein